MTTFNVQLPAQNTFLIRPSVLRTFMSYNMEDALAYHEPSIQTVLIQSSFLLLLNAVRFVLDRFLACGMIGQIFLGVLFGQPSHLSLLSIEFQNAIVPLGYLGLSLLCFEGGLHSPLGQLWATKYLSIAIALTGIALPIALSFLLIPLINASNTAGSVADATALQAFAAGAALSATSLGTSFSIISVAGLQREKIGIILSSAAMIDDVIGLILIAVIKSLGGLDGGDSKLGMAVARPITASIGSVVVLSFLLWLYQHASITIAGSRRLETVRKSVSALNADHQLKCQMVFHLIVLIAFVAAGSYAGASPLFMAFLSGTAITWISRASPPSNIQEPAEVHHKFFHQVQEHILLPFFFASIGFAIPIRKMFAPQIIWKGLVYSLLMALAKFATSIWIFMSKTESFAVAAATSIESSAGNKAGTPNLTRKSAALVIGFAMMARGEVSFLIASIAQTAGIFSNSEMYLIIVWASMLCTIIGPIGTGVVVKSIRAQKPDDGDIFSSTAS